MKLVVVESPAKAKTIAQYLGKDYIVLPSVGHIRQLPSKNGSVIPEENFKMIYEIIPKAVKNVAEIVAAAKKSDIIYLASDPDREGEGIAQAVYDVLLEKKAITKDKIKRITYTEITKTAVKTAIDNARNIDKDLVEAQQSRLALDYLVGFNLSPILWRKLPGSRSAGRVQSVALRIIVEREFEIRKFIPQEYWTIVIQTKNKKSEKLLCRVVKYNKESFDTNFPNNEKIATEIEDLIKQYGEIKVIKKDTKDVKQNPYPPFTTATLQQEASKKLGFPSKKTMQLAQKLYEGIATDKEAKGLITYMRTDGMYIEENALKNIRQFIDSKFGKDYLPKAGILYKTKAKNAQEAHEAIRPTDIEITPEYLSRFVDKDMLKLYELIWRRTLACQMTPAIQTRETIDFESVFNSTSLKGNENSILSRANGSRIKFEGYLKAYNSKDNIETYDEDIDENDSILPEVKEGEILKVIETEKGQHFTAPPPRYTEATLIKTLESLGIGRPSTYATIISILQDREYVKLEKRQFTPESRGIVVTSFLKEFFTKYVEYDFTAKLEEDLDLISDGKLDRLKFLNHFWDGFIKNVKDTSTIDIPTVAANLTKVLTNFLFFKDGKINNDCPDCKNGKLKINIGKFGPYLGCTNYPECKYIQNFVKASSNNNADGDSSGGNVDFKTAQTNENGEAISFKNKSDEDIIFKIGKFGPYLEISIKGKKIKNCSLPKGTTKDTINEKLALFYSQLPYKIGKDGEGNDITLNIGRFGPYLFHNKKFYSIKTKPLHEITLEECLGMLK